MKSIICITPDVIEAHEENGYNPQVLYTSTTQNLGPWNVSEGNKILLHIPRNATPKYLSEAAELREKLKDEQNFHVVADQPQDFRSLRKYPSIPLSIYMKLI